MSTPTTFTNDVTVNSRLFVTDDIVVGTTIATGTTTNYGNVDNKKDTSVGNRLFVKKDAALSKRLFLDYNAYLYKDLNVVGNIKCSTLEVTNGFNTNYQIGSIPSNAIAGINSINKDLGTKKRLFIDNDATLKKRACIKFSHHIPDSGTWTETTLTGAVSGVAVDRRNSSQRRCR